jgi:hypothetical protein
MIVLWSKSDLNAPGLTGTLWCTTVLFSDLLNAPGPTGTLWCTPVHNWTMLRPPPCSWSDTNFLVCTCAQTSCCPTSSMLLVRQDHCVSHLCTTALCSDLLHAPGSTQTLWCTPFTTVLWSTLLNAPGPTGTLWFHICAQQHYAPTSSMLQVQQEHYCAHLCMIGLCSDLLHAPGPT